MHGEQYHKTKAAIMTPIREFFAMLDDRTARDVQASRNRVRRYARISLGLTIGTAAFTLVAFLVLVRLIVTPIRAMIERLKDIAEGEGDMTRRVDESRRNELGELGHWFNTFIQMVHDILCRVKRTSETVATAASEIAAASREQQAMVGDFSASSGQIAAAVKEISATGTELTRTLEEVSRVAGESAAIADTGRSGLSDVESNIQALLESTRSISSKLNVIDERSEGINQIVTTIVKVADQTNLLSVNAAIEAQKAGEYGVGFRVVARETRRLADQTAEATLDIERDVGATQSAVSEGVAEMDRLRARVGELVAASCRTRRATWKHHRTGAYAYGPLRVGERGHGAAVAGDSADQRSHGLAHGERRPHERDRRRSSRRRPSTYAKRRSRSGARSNASSCCRRVTQFGRRIKKEAHSHSTRGRAEPGGACTTQRNAKR